MAEKPPIYIPPKTPCDIVSDGRLESSRYLSFGDTFVRCANPFLEDQVLGEQMLQHGQTLTTSGFRELTCPSCHVCVPARLPLSLFNPSSEQLRTLSRNSDLGVIFAQNIPDLKINGVHNEHINLVEYYMQKRFTGDVGFSGELYLERFRNLPGFSTHHLSVREADGALAGALIYHRTRNSSYGTMFFYEPALRSRAIGHFMMLNLIKKLQDDGVTHLYLGHWTPDATSYSWKGKFRPLELRINGEWQVFDDASLHKLRIGDQNAKDAQAYPAKRAMLRPQIS